MLKQIFLFFALLNMMFSAKFGKDSVVIAINCGGDEYEDESGVIYKKVSLKTKSNYL
jgi:hypothetical protein